MKLKKITNKKTNEVKFTAFISYIKNLCKCKCSDIVKSLTKKSKFECEDYIIEEINITSDEECLEKTGMNIEDLISNLNK